MCSGSGRVLRRRTVFTLNTLLVWAALLWLPGIIQDNVVRHFALLGSSNGTIPTQDKWFVCNEGGKVLPVLFAGIQKSGSRTMWEDMKTVLYQKPGCMDASHCKELHFFEKPHHPAELPYTHSFGGENCSSVAPGILYTDFTPTNIFVNDAPTKMRLVYQSKFQEPIFLLGLREPMRRAFSAYNFLSRTGQLEKAPGNFTEFVRGVLKIWDISGRDDEGLYEQQYFHQGWDQIVFKGLYYYEFRRFLREGFLPSQFIVYPSSLYLKHRDDLDTNPVLQAVRARLGRNVLRPGKNVTIVKEGFHRDGDGRAPETELPPDLCTRLDKEVIQPANRKLMKLLATEFGNGMSLVGYTGKVGDVAAVTEWMTSMWLF